MSNSLQAGTARNLQLPGSDSASPLHSQRECASVFLLAANITCSTTLYVDSNFRGKKYTLNGGNIVIGVDTSVTPNTPIAPAPSVDARIWDFAPVGQRAYA